MPLTMTLIRAKRECVFASWNLEGGITRVPWPGEATPNDRQTKRNSRTESVGIPRFAAATPKGLWSLSGAKTNRFAEPRRSAVRAKPSLRWRATRVPGKAYPGTKWREPRGQIAL